MKKKVLLISSWLDNITERRQRIMAESPYLKDYEISHVFASTQPYGMVESERFYQTVKNKIQENSTEVLLVHTGASFHQYPNEFIEALFKLKDSFPDLKIGVERGRISNEDLNKIGIFDNLPEINKIEDLFFKVAYGKI